MRRAIGIIVPSGNVVVERASIAFAATMPGLDLHFARVPVRGSHDPFPDGYDVSAFIAAAEMLADARPGVLVWAGSKGVLVGVDHDEALRSRIETRTGIAFTTSTLAWLDVARERGVRRLGLITPYTTSYQRRLVNGFVQLGFECVAEDHFDISDNLAYADVGEREILGMAQRVAAARPDAILGWCTNFQSAFCAEAIARQTGVPFFDATLLALYAAIAHLDREVEWTSPSLATLAS